MKKVVFITGISSGFGKHTAMMLSKRGHTVYGTVRKSLVTDPAVNVLTMDLIDNESIRRAVQEVKEREGRIDVLINNGGMHTGGPIETLPDEFVRLQIETSFMGMVSLTREVLPLMRAGGGGRIINISSIGGLMGLPFQGYYSAAKFAVEGFSEALRMETANFNIQVVVINPGDFHTNNSANRRNYLAPSGEGDPYAIQFNKSLAIIEHDEGNGWGPERLAEKLARIVDCVKPRQRYIIGSFDQKLAVLLKKLLPGRLFTMILAGHYGLSSNTKK